jgi:hypothetical protein
MEPIYLENFSSPKDITDNYGVDESELAGAEVLLAWYGYGSYCGDSFVLFRKDGKLWEVNGSHCSCYGLEGQWSPEETSPEALLKREIYDSCDGGSEANVRLHDLARSMTPTAGGES